PDGPSRQSTSPGSAVSVTSRKVSLSGPKAWLMRSKASLAAKLTPAVTRLAARRSSLTSAKQPPTPAARHPLGRCARSITPAARCQQTELLEVDVGQRILVRRKLVGICGRLRHAKVRRHARRKQAGALQFLDTGEVADF